MALSANKKAQKKEKQARQEREAYVQSAAFSKGPSLISPFLDAGWDEAARLYIQTGDESLKNDFPRPRTENV